MNIKAQLCNIVKTQKSALGLTYDQIVKLGEGAFHKSQLSSVLRHDGHDVSVDVIVDIIHAIGSEIELVETNRSDLIELKERLEALKLKG